MVTLPLGIATGAEGELPRAATSAPNGAPTAVNSGGASFPMGSVPLGAPGAAPIAVLADPTNHRVYVEDSPAVLIELDPQSGQRIATWTIGNSSIGANAPASLALNESSQQLWVLGPGPLGVSEVNLNASIVAQSVELPVGCGAVLGLAFAPVQPSVWVACAEGVYALSAVNGSLVYSYPAPLGAIFPSGTIVYDPAHEQVIVAGVIAPSQGTEGLAFFDPTSLSFVRALAFAGCCENVKPTGGGVINAATNELVLTATVGSSTWGLATLNATTYALSSFAFFPVSGHPVGIAEASGSSPTVYLALYGARSVGAFDLRTDELGTTVPTNGLVAAVAIDGTVNLAFAADVDTAQLFVLDLPTLGVRSVVPVGGEPGAIAYDPASGLLWVGNSNNITVVSDTTHQVVATLPIDFGPAAIAINATTHRAYVATYDNANVTVYDTTSYAVLGTFEVDAGPAAIPQVPNGLIYVACQSAYHGRLDVISVGSGGTYTTVARLTVGNVPSSVTYDPATNEVLVANPFTDNLSVISASAHPSVVATVALPGFNPWSIAYDGRSSELFLSDANLAFDVTTGKESSQVDALSAVNYSLVGSVTVDPVTYGIVYDPLVDFVFAVSYIFSTVDVIDPGALSWAATLGVGTNPYGAIFDPGTQEVYVGNTLSANLTYISTPAPVYPVVFTEAGLTNGTWAVTLGGSTVSAADGTSITFLVSNGTFAFTVGATGATANPASGTVQIAGAPIAEAISFTPSSGSGSGAGGGAWWSGSGGYYLLLDVALAAAIVAVLALFLWRRRGPRRPTPAGPPLPTAEGGKPL